MKKTIQPIEFKYQSNPDPLCCAICRDRMAKNEVRIEVVDDGFMNVYLCEKCSHMTSEAIFNLLKK